MAVDKSIESTRAMNNSSKVNAVKGAEGENKKPSNNKKTRMPKFIAAIVRYIKEIVYEMSKVIYPTVHNVGRQTVIVIVFVVVLMLLITALDFLFGLGAGAIFDAGK